MWQTHNIQFANFDVTSLCVVWFCSGALWGGLPEQQWNAPNKNSTQFSGISREKYLLTPLPRPDPPLNHTKNGGSIITCRPGCSCELPVPVLPH